MNKRILTRVLSFVLVLCLLVPLIPDLGLDFAGVTASAALSTTGVTYFKAGSRNCYKGGDIKDLKHETIAIDGVTYIRVDDLTSYANVANVTAEKITIDGIQYVAALDGEQVGTNGNSTYYTYVSNMNLVAVATTNVFSNASNSDQTTLINMFIYSDIDITVDSTKNHPYLLADQDQFDMLRDAYKAEEGDANYDPVLKSYLEALVVNANNVFKTFAKDDNGSIDTSKGTISGQAALYNHPYSSNDGYDAGGRLPEASSHAERIAYLAFGYQVTGDVKYARLAFEYTACLCNWDHWGADHFLNAADTASALALVFDWCYNVWQDKNMSYTIGSKTYNFTEVRNNIFMKTLYAGMEDTKSGSPTYSKKDNNWNAVCTGGMTLMGLAFMKEGYSYTGLGSKLGSYTTMNQMAAELIKLNLGTLKDNALWMYAPDGSYRESATYWSYGTTALFKLITALKNVQGTDFGISATAGVDVTAYFPYYAQTGEGLKWVYHDDSGTDLPTTANALYGAVIGDSNIVSYRKYLITNGAATPHYFDTLMYDANISDQSFGAMELDHYFEGMQGYATRSSWQAGSMYAAFMGGDQQHTHAQLDSGAFVYYNAGVKWFEDIGAESYGISNYGYGDSGIGDAGNTYPHYAASAEGNNTLVSLTTGKTGSKYYGQEYDGVTATMTKSVSNEHGSYAILDQSEIYNKSGAKRGMLTTNDRRTLVIQDEVNFGNTDAKYWFGHVNKDKTITLSDGGTVAYITDGKSTIRCSIVTPPGVTKPTFEVVDAGYGSKVLSGTNSKPATNANEYADDWYRLQIKTTASNVQLAVVIELVSALDDPTYVAYEWTSMSDWKESIITPDGRSYDDKVLLSQNFDSDGIGSYDASNGNVKIFNTLIDGDNAMGLYANSASNSASSFNLAAAPARVQEASIGAGMLIAEFDLATLDEIPDKIQLGIYGTDIYPIVSAYVNDSAFFGDLGRDFRHITIVIDEDNRMYYVYSGDNLMQKGEYRSKSFANLSIRLTTTDGVCSDGTLLIDNVTIRTFTQDYDVLDDVLTSGSGMSTWEDRQSPDTTASDATGNVAEIYNNVDIAPDSDKDTPVVDLWNWSGVVGTSIGTATVQPKAGTVTVKTFGELEKLIATGNYTHVNLLAGNENYAVINIENPITVYTNGNEFYARSSTLVCNIKDDTYVYEEGTVEAIFIINGADHVVTLTSSDYASYNVPAESIGEIRHAVVDGVNKYYQIPKDAWSNTPGGERLYGKELIVTSRNNEFYLAGEMEYNGIYVLHMNDGTIAAGGSVADFFADCANTSGAYTAISLLSDIYYDAGNDGKVGTVTFKNNIDIYLNGNTITHETHVDSDHVFILSNDKKVNIYGPGKINDIANSSNIIYTAYNGGITPQEMTVKDVELVSSFNMVQHRSGTLTLDNCKISLTKNNNILRVINYLGGLNKYDGEHIGHLIINGGEIDATNITNTSAFAIQVGNNSHLTVMGGATIKTANGKTPVNIENGNAINDMYVHFGEVYFNSDKPVTVTTGNGVTVVTLETLLSDGRISYASGAPLKYDATGVLSGVTEIAKGYVAARTGSDGYAYIVMKEEEAAKINWVANGNTFTEYWMPGVVPKVLGTAKTNLASLTASAGYKYTYDMSSLNNEPLKSGTYTFNATAMPNASFKMNVSFYNDLIVTLLFQETNIAGLNGNLTYKSFTVNGKTYTPDQCQKLVVDGDTYYRVTLHFNPKTVDDSISIFIDASYGENSYKITATTSVSYYANTIMSSDTSSDELKTLMASILEYGSAAAKYDGDKFSAGSCDAINDKYGEVEKIVGEYYPDNKSTKPIAHAIQSAYLNLADATNFVFKFNSSFSGTVEFYYEALIDVEATVDGLMRVELEIENGIVTYIDGEAADAVSNIYELQMRALDMDAEIYIVIDGEDNGDYYTLDMYYAKVIQEDGDLKDLLLALRAYAVAAENYKDTVA